MAEVEQRDILLCNCKWMRLQVQELEARQMEIMLALRRQREQQQEHEERFERLDYCVYDDRENSRLNFDTLHVNVEQRFQILQQQTASQSSASGSSAPEHERESFIKHKMDEHDELFDKLDLSFMFLKRTFEEDSASSTISFNQMNAHLNLQAERLQSLEDRFQKRQTEFMMIRAVHEERLDRLDSSVYDHRENSVGAFEMLAKNIERLDRTLQEDREASVLVFRQLTTRLNAQAKTLDNFKQRFGNQSCDQVYMFRASMERCDELEALLRLAVAGVADLQGLD